MSGKGFNLEGKIVIVTGASSGIGKAAALAFGREGAIVVVSARREKEGAEVAQAIINAGGKASFIRADVTSEEQVRHLVDQSVRMYGRIDCAFNNAGQEGLIAPLLEQTSENFDLVMNTNVRSVFWCMQYQIAAMKKPGGGAIVNNSSMGAFIGFPHAAIYIASKHAVMGLTKTAALEHFKDGIRINAVNPGIIDTPFQDRLWGSAEAKYGFANGTAPGRIGTSEEVADAVLFLASDRASFFSGQGVVMDGGYTVQ
jgi:NAD(P)-dependent dehydrogenase (short-subunit alcohol dehydrogenase family)